MGENFEDMIRRDPQGAWDRIKPIHTEMKAKEPAAEVVKVAIDHAKSLGFAEGVKVRLKEQEEIGVVTGFNERTEGFYPGNRYPIVVKFERGTFEYGPDFLEIVE